MRNAYRIVLTWCLGVVICASHAAASGYQRQVAKNNDSQNRSANDLHITFGWPVLGAKAKPPVQPPGKDADGAISADGKTADFAAPLIGSVAAGGLTYVDFSNLLSSVEYNYIVADESYFTQDGARLDGFTLTGPAMYINADTYYGETEKKVSIRNLTNEQYYVSSLQLYRNNLLSNYNLEDYTAPTGELVATIAPFVLAPGEKREFSFGPSLPGTYVLAGGDFYPEGGVPSPPYRLYAAAEVVPEPCAGAVCAAGVGLMLLRRTRRR